MDREPCPWRVVDDAGGAFVFGLVGGTIWHSFGGFRNAPKGHRISHAVARVKARTPILGGSFAVWGTIFSCFDCTISHFRQKEDPWNAILSGAATGGVLAARAGLKSAGKNALVGGLILAAIEGLNVAITRVVVPMMEEQQMQQAGPGERVIDLLEPPEDPLRAHLRRSRRQQLSPSPSPSKSFDLGSGFGLLGGNNNSGSSGGSTEDSLHALRLGGGSEGFDIEKVDTFSDAGSDWEKKQAAEKAEQDAQEQGSKPFWRIW